MTDEGLEGHVDVDGGWLGLAWLEFIRTRLSVCVCIVVSGEIKVNHWGFYKGYNGEVD